MTYQEALDYISSLAPRGWRMGLDRMRAFALAAGLEDALGGSTPRYIHIAGTNGKGSVTAYVRDILISQGYRTGAYFSPFVFDPLERWQLNGENINPDVFAKLTEDLIPIAAAFEGTEYGGISEFEFKTALAFKFFKESKCDWVALEVGLGGKLDATNIITSACSVIVSIGLDHMSVLGHTIKEIAGEKAGIIKKETPVVFPPLGDDADEVVEDAAKAVHSPVVRPAQVDIETGIKGTMQSQNAAAALAAVEAAGALHDKKAAVISVSKTTLPGRFQSVTSGGVSFLLDGAHNEAAARVLAETLRKERPGTKFTLVTGMVEGHDPSGFYRTILPFIGRIICPPIGFHRALDPLELEKAIKTVRPDMQVSAVESLEDALREAKAIGSEVLVTGSFYLVGEVGNRLKA